MPTITTNIDQVIPVLIKNLKAAGGEAMSNAEQYFQDKYGVGMVAWLMNGSPQEDKLSEIKLISRCLRDNDWSLLEDALDEDIEGEEDEDEEKEDADTDPNDDIDPDDKDEQPEPVAVVEPVATVTPKQDDAGAALLNAIKQFTGNAAPQVDEKRITELAEAAAKKVMADFVVDLIATLNKYKA